MGNGIITTIRGILGTLLGPGQGHLGLGTRPSIQALSSRVVGGQTASGKGGRMLPPSEAPSKDETL